MRPPEERKVVPHLPEEVLRSALAAARFPQVPDGHVAYERGAKTKAKSSEAIRLAYEGDAWLDWRVRRMLCRMLSHSQRDLDFFKKILCSNDLWKWMAHITGVEAKLNPRLTASDGYPKFIADAFEAHFGALLVEGREKEAIAWLDAVLPALVNAIIKGRRASATSDDHEKSKIQCVARHAQRQVSPVRKRSRDASVHSSESEDEDSFSSIGQGNDGTSSQGPDMPLHSLEHAAKRAKLLE